MKTFLKEMTFRLLPFAIAGVKELKELWSYVYPYKPLP
jgi:hypothetical protein